MGSALRVYSEDLDAAGIVGQDQQQVGLEPLTDSESTLAVLPVDLDPLLLREGQGSPVGDDLVSFLDLHADPRPADCFDS